MYTLEYPNPENISPDTIHNAIYARLHSQKPKYYCSFFNRDNDGTIKSIYMLKKQKAPCIEVIIGKDKTTINSENDLSLCMNELMTDAGRYAPLTFSKALKATALSLFYWIWIFFFAFNEASVLNTVLLKDIHADFLIIELISFIVYFPGYLYMKYKLNLRLRRIIFIQAGGFFIVIAPIILFSGLLLYYRMKDIILASFSEEFICHLREYYYNIMNIEMIIAMPFLIAAHVFPSCSFELLAEFIYTEIKKQKANYILKTEE